MAAMARSMLPAMRSAVFLMAPPHTIMGSTKRREGKHAMAQDHDDHHDHHEHGSELSEMQLRVRALETVLAEKGYIDPAALDVIIEAYETKIGPHNGAAVVAKAWSNPEFKRRLLADGTATVRALGYE